MPLSLNILPCLSYKEPYTRIFTLLAWGSLLKYIQFLSFFRFFNYTNILESILHQTTFVFVALLPSLLSINIL